jgi:hypothetical protein
VGLKLTGAGAGDNIIALEEDKDPVVDGARIEYHRGQVVEWYENKPEGLEQGFTVKEKMEGEGPLSLVIHISGDIKPVVSDNDGAVDFLSFDNRRVLRYGKLKSFDAKGHPLKNHLQVAGNTIRIVIADSNAVYPIFVDPLLTSPSWTAESNQAEASFGNSVGTAGDVNNDGYDDVIVGAHYYDNGHTNEGRAYLYLGSASGLSNTASWTAESNQASAQLGHSVGTAGDVNNDGYDDVIVGANLYDNGQTNEGRAYLYLGSDSGLSTTSDWTAESNQAYAYFGYSVGTAGDVNNDGYDDVIVGAKNYSNGQTYEGRAFVYRGFRPTAVLLSSEVGTVGFYLLRLDEATGKYLKLNNKLLPGLLHSPQGGVYRYVDEGAEPGGTYTYKLVEVEFKGKRRSYGPFTVTVGGEGIGGSAGILAQSSTEVPVSGFSKKAHKKSGVKKLRIQSTALTSGAATAPVVSDTVRIAVNQSGLYYVDASEIAAVMGQSINTVTGWIKQKALILSNQGQMVSWLAAAGNVGIYFYGEAIESIYTNGNVYIITQRKAGAGLTMQVVKGKGPYPGSGYETFTETIHVEEDHYALTALFDDPQADYWLWDYIIADYPSKTFHISADGVASAGTATLKVHLQGVTDTDSAPDHHVEVSLNGTSIGEGYWDGASAHELVCTFDQYLLYEEDNTIEVTGLLDTGAPYSVFYVDSFDLTYERYYQAVGDRALVRGDGNNVIIIDGFTTGDIYVFELSDPKRPELIAASTVDNGAPDGSYRVSFTPAAPDEPYLALSLVAASTPVSVTPDTPSKLKRKTNRADYLVIAPSELKQVAVRLAGYRQSRGLDTMVVELQDIYDEFNYGLSSPEAIWDFLSYAYRKWRKAPRYVVLAGEGTYDYKDNQGYGDNLLPVLMVATPHGLFASDNWFVDVVGDDGVPEMAIGRLPVVTSLELDALIDKIIAYESTGGSWRDHVLMVADGPDDGGEFPADSDVVAALLPPQYTAKKIYLSEHTTGEARQLVQDGINDGALLLNYIGHAGLDRLAQEGMLRSSDVDTFVNGYKLPVVTAMTCVAGRFAIPGLDSLGELLVLHEGGGAIATWAPTGFSLNALAVILDTSFFSTAFVDGENILGEVVLKALVDYAGAGKPVYMLDIYNLLGDPALEMR